MSRIHLFISSTSDALQSQKAIDFARQALVNGDEIIQVFFYGRAVYQLANPELITSWQSLNLPPFCLKICQKYQEQFQLSYPTSIFSQAGLIDFFARHWQDQGILVQF